MGTIKSQPLGVPPGPLVYSGLPLALVHLCDAIASLQLNAVFLPFMSKQEL